MKNKASEYAAKFAARNKRLGLGPTEVTHGEFNAPEGAKVIFSSDPFESHVKSKNIVVSSIQHLNELVGYDSNYFKGKVSYPASLCKKLAQKVSSVKSKTELRQKLTAEDKNNIRVASHAYILGDSKKVEEYADIINLLKFPTTLAAFVGDNLNVKNNIVVTGGTSESPVIWNYNKITVYPGGSITSHTNFIMKCNSFVVSEGRALDANGEEENDIITANVADPSPPQAADGRDGLEGETGERGSDAESKYSSGNCSYSCKTKAGNGKQGGRGNDGVNGTTPAENAGDQGVYVGELGDVIGNITVHAGGGNGQHGGDGGIGGNGGEGGPPGHQSAENVCTPADKGIRGPGGDGGDAGNGQNGGNGADTMVTYTSITGVPKGVNVGGVGGNPGSPGTGGQGNPGGNNGADGVGGTTGLPSTIEIIKAN